MLEEEVYAGGEKGGSKSQEDNAELEAKVGKGIVVKHDPGDGAYCFEDCTESKGDAEADPTSVEEGLDREAGGR